MPMDEHFSQVFVATMDDILLAKKLVAGRSANLIAFAR